MVNDNIIGEFVDAIKTPRVDTNTVYSAVVSRVDKEGTVWVYLAGSDKETPTSSSSAEVKEGDAVTVEWRNNKLYIAGNYSNPSAGLARVVNVEQAAQVANEAAESAVADAGRAREAAESAVADASSAASAANTAKNSAATALENLSQVQSVLEVAEWIATHGTYEKASTFNPNATYYTLTATEVSTPSDDDKDSNGVLIYYELTNGVYVRTTDTSVDGTKTYYTVVGTPVSQPVAADIGQYYTLAVTEAMSNYIKSHVALTDDGLYVMADDSEWKVLVADDGVYIVNPDGEYVAQYKSSITIGTDDNLHALITNKGFSLKDPNWTSALASSSDYFKVEDFRDDNGEYAITKSCIATKNRADSDYLPTVTVGVPIDSFSVMTESGLGRYDDTDAWSIIDASKGTLRRNSAIYNQTAVLFSYVTITTSSPKAKALTFGSRFGNRLVPVAYGILSSAFGENNTASGYATFVAGVGNDASGSMSMAFGQGNATAANNSVAIGYQNVIQSDEDRAIVIGNSNHGLGIDANGDAVFTDSVTAYSLEATTNVIGEDLLLQLDTSSASGTDYDIYTALQSLGWDTDCIV